MTAQAQDYVTFMRKRYQLLGIHAEGHRQDQELSLFDPRDFGLEPTMMSTGCYRGFHCNYRITGDRIFLEELKIRVANRHYLPINNVDPVLEGCLAEGTQSGAYSNIHLHIKFSGRLRLARDLISGSHRNMGFQETTSFKRVIDLVIDNGAVVAVEDLSEKLRLLRSVQRVVQDYMLRNFLPNETIREFNQHYGIIDDDIEDSFSRHLRAINPQEVLFILEKAIVSKQRPDWFIANFAECYENCHQYAFSLEALNYLGAPEKLQEYLVDFITKDTSEEQVVLSFLRALLDSKAKKVWGETLHVIIRREYQKSGIPLLKKRFKSFMSNSTSKSWFHGD